MKGWITGTALIALVAGAAQAATPPDPLHSPMWDLQAERLFGHDPVVFDARVIVTVPLLAENQHVFPVTLDARALPDVRRIVVLVDLDPIPVPVDFVPGKAAPWLALRIKLDQRTPVRVAAQTGDGTWHVAGKWVDAAGGGCSAPPASRARGDWAVHLGEVRGAVWRGNDGSGTPFTRLRFSVRHPMDTGLVDNIPAYNLETVRVTAGGEMMAQMTVSGSMSEDPTFTLLLPAGEGRPIGIAMRDSSGREFTGMVH
jgi:sulfur-oxidizing protein SoxY